MAQCCTACTPHPTQTLGAPPVGLQLAGVATNLAAGLMGAKWGIRYTLLTGLCLQLVGIGMLFGWQVGAGSGGRAWRWHAVAQVCARQCRTGPARCRLQLCGPLDRRPAARITARPHGPRLCTLQDSWSKTEAIIYVTAAQLMCGIAKDLTKLGGKTVTKLVTPGV